ncbi:16S rRNA (guanine(527)-N(7))-methyltransferase RsmG [Fusobacterium sp.]|uniref:16S rRNA (guanine(527)-N(7))-methyltransferase RsmG n=1 Tax=Fusobacterium sp. TaxID=68766 RepID=UPI00261B4460|nr:16S rRNA (guanine(527)-N(7))-methyltransferase RsmG [Fusobacterium sp.]
MREFLVNGLKEIGVEYTEKKVDNLLKYLTLLQEYNSHTNLTAVRDEKSMIEKHFLDSLLLQNLLDDSMKTAIDVGTGAGFPGMVLAIFNENIKFTLMDSIGKKTKFLQLVKDELNLENVEVVTSRAEDYISDEKRESYDLGLCRGVSKLSTILEYIIPFLKKDGVFLSQKMEGTGEETEAQNALEILNSEIIKIFNFELPFCKDPRVVIKIEKREKTDKKYPRRSGIPLKRPL